MEYDVVHSKGSSNLKTYFIEFIQTLAVCLVIGIIIYWQIAQPHKVSGASMYPTFHNGDYIITNKLLYKFSPPQHGDVIVLKNPKNQSEDFIKRIIGVPGDKVKIQAGKVYVNGELVHEGYLNSSVYTPPGNFLHEGEEITVEPDKYFVLGDNRPHSSDSKEWGFVPKELVLGKVFVRYWPQTSIGVNPGDKSGPPAPMETPQ